MAETGRLTCRRARPLGVPLRPVTALRIAIIVGGRWSVWEALAALGLALSRRGAVARRDRQGARMRR